MRNLTILLCILSLWSPTLADQSSDDLTLSLRPEWRKTPHREGWVVVAELHNRGGPKVVPARTCGRVPWASALTLRTRKQGKIQEHAVGFIDIRSVHAHGPFTIGTGQTLSHDIWLEDQLLEFDSNSVEGLEISAKLQAKGEANISTPGLKPISAPKVAAKTWNGVVHSPWVTIGE